MHFFFQFLGMIFPVAFQNDFTILIIYSFQTWKLNMPVIQRQKRQHITKKPWRQIHQLPLF